MNPLVVLSLFLTYAIVCGQTPEYDVINNDADLITQMMGIHSIVDPAVNNQATVAVCPDTYCNTFCQFGYIKAQGSDCHTCVCQTEQANNALSAGKQCNSNLRCFAPCPTGYKLDRGCPTCDCAPDSNPTPHELILISAGSFESSIAVYQYTPDNTHPLGFRNMVLHCNRTLTAITVCIHNHTACVGRLDELIVLAKYLTKRVLPETVHVFALANGGVRALKGDGAQEFLDVFTTGFNDPALNNTFQFEGPARMISGEEEAAYSWVALNYLQGFFDVDKPVIDGVHVVSNSSGVVDVACESAQVAFLPSNTPRTGAFPLTLGNTKYTLYTHSYMGLGENSLVRNMAEANIQGIENSTDHNENSTTTETPSWNNPCFLQGDNKTINNTAGQSTVHIGTGDDGKCLQLTLEQLKLTPESCHTQPCAIGDVYQPTLVSGMPLYAINHFADTVENFMDLGKIPTTQPIEPRLVWDNAFYLYCTMTKEQVTAMGVAPDVASSRCLMGMYGPELLYRLGVPNQDTNMHVATHINKQPVDWRLGAMVLNTAERFASERRNSCDN